MSRQLAAMLLALAASHSHGERRQRPGTLEDMRLPIEPRVDPEQAEKVRQELRARRKTNFEKQKKQ